MESEVELDERDEKKSSFKWESKKIEWGKLMLDREEKRKEVWNEWERKGNRKWYLLG